MKTLVLTVIALIALAGRTPAQEVPYHDPGLKKIVQIAIVCKDVEACSQRWAKLLAMDPPRISTTVPGHEAKMVYRGKPSDGRVKLAFFGTGQTVLELMEPLGPDTSWKEHLDRYGEGVHHIAFQVEDLEKTLASLEKQGMPLIHRGRFDKDNGDYAYVESKDKLGVTVELLHNDKK